MRAEIESYWSRVERIMSRYVEARAADYSIEKGDFIKAAIQAPK